MSGRPTPELNVGHSHSAQRKNGLRKFGLTLPEFWVPRGTTNALSVSQTNLPAPKIEQRSKMHFLGGLACLSPFMIDHGSWSRLSITIARIWRSTIWGLESKGPTPTI